MDSRQRQIGFGLVELMVSITLGLLLTAAVLQTFVAANTTYRIQNALSRVQETSRYAIHFLGQDMRMAGYMGCAALDTVSVNIISDNPPSDVSFNLASVATGTNDVAADNDFDAAAGTDIVNIKRASSLSAKLTGNMTSENANIKITHNDMGLVAGDYVLVSDCLAADLFTATSVSKNSGVINIVHSENVNTTNRLSKAYGPDAEVFGFETVTYFIKDTGRTTANGNPIHALYSQRRTMGSGGSDPDAYELVEGVENMQLTYGEDTNSDSNVDRYVNAANVGNWENVVSVQVELLIVGDEENIVAKTGSDLAQTVTFNGAVVNNTDGRYRRALSYAFAIRNKLP